jgi:hypothetical protein
MVAGEAGGAWLLATHQPSDQARETGAVVLVQQRAVVERNAKDFLGLPAKDVLGLRRPAHQLEIAVPLQHRQRGVVDVRREHPVDALQLLLVALLVVMSVCRVYAITCRGVLRGVVDRFQRSRPGWIDRSVKPPRRQHASNSYLGSAPRRALPHRAAVIAFIPSHSSLWRLTGSGNSGR